MDRITLFGEPRHRTGGAGPGLTGQPLLLDTRHDDLLESRVDQLQARLARGHAGEREAEVMQVLRPATAWSRRAGCS